MGEYLTPCEHCGQEKHIKTLEIFRKKSIMKGINLTTYIK